VLLRPAKERQRRLQARVAGLQAGQEYTWEQLAAAFGFEASLFQVGGEMLSRPDFNALLLITHPGGA
jgi:hypothetical protein